MTFLGKNPLKTGNSVPFFRCSKILGEAGKQEILQKNVPKILDIKSSSQQIFSENCRWVPLIISANDSYFAILVCLKFPTHTYTKLTVSAILVRKNYLFPSEPSLTFYK